MIARFAAKQQGFKACAKYHNVVGSTNDGAKCKKLLFVSVELWQLILYFLLGISPASMYNMPTFRNHVSVPSSKAGSRLSD